MTNIDHRKNLLIALALFLLALAVRLPGLDVFFTADEFLWVDRSRNFLGGLLSSDFECLLPDIENETPMPAQGLACTLQTGHPGVLTMWTGAAGITLEWLTRPADDGRTLSEFVNQLQIDPVNRATIIPVRLPTVIITSLFVAVAFLLLTRLFRPPVPLLASLLLALNPFHVALSRVLHHDALSTSFIITSALSLIIYFGVERRKRWLVLGGITAGVAMLSKSTGFFVIPYAGLLALWSLAANWARGNGSFRRLLGRTLLDGLLWAAIVAATFAALWPAMWVIPGHALYTIYAVGFKYAEGGHAKGVLFFNTISQDPGFFFYPVMWFLRTNFWSMLGVFVAAGASLGALRRRWRQPGAFFNRFSPRGFDDKTGLMLWISAFLFFFFIAVAVLVDKKQDRYSLPLYPMLDMAAAVGLWVLVRHRKPVIQNGLVVAILVVNLALIGWNAPYSFAYYNPLVGGIKAAAQTVTVGWGEGLDKAAAYLNTKPDAANLKVASWYGSTFAPYFAGETLHYSDQKGNALGGDYVVFYINQLQRHYPDDEIWDYFNAHFTLDRAIPLGGVDVAWIYTGPGIGHYVEYQTYDGIAGLLGWDWFGPVSPDDGSVIAGNEMPYSLFWEYLGKVPEERFFARLIGADGRIWAEALSAPTAEYADASVWREGQIIEERGTLVVPAGTPPGDYALQIGFYTLAPAIPDGELTFPTLNTPLDGPLQVISVAAAPPVAQLDGISVGDLQLLTAESVFAPDGESLDFELVWAAPQPTGHAYQAGFALVDEASGKSVWAWEAQPLIAFLPTSNWPAAVPLRTQWHLPLDDPHAPGGTYRLQMSVVDESGLVEPVDFGPVNLPGRTRSFVAPPVSDAISADLGDGIGLRGVDFDSQSMIPGQVAPVTLVWQSLAPVDLDYTVFLQLIGPDGQVVAQHDAQPQTGDAPTRTWTPGEVVVDSHPLQLPADLPPGEYRLIAGMYNFDTGQRLPVTQDGVSADFVLLRTWDR